MTWPPVPFDPELAAALAVIAPELPAEFSHEGVQAARRQAEEWAPSDEDLRREGFFEVNSTLRERLVHAEAVLGWPVRTPRGRLRLQLALITRRLVRPLPSSP